MAGYIGNTAAFLSSTSGADIDGTVTADGLTVDTTTLVVDSTNNRVGIGTSSPAITLDVAGSATIGTDTAGILNVKGGSSTSPQVRFFDGGTGRARIGVPTGQTYLSLSGSDTLTPDAVIDSSGNVGIGATSPQQLLHINGGAADTAFQITNSASGSTATDGFSITVENPTPDVVLRNRESSNMRFLTANTERMRIDSSGNVGIGTSSPATPLDVTKAGGGNFVATFQNTTSATPYGVHIKDAASGANGYPLLQVTNSAGSSPYLLVHSGTGNVGIGTSSPLQDLHISSTSGTKAIFERTGSTGAYIGLKDSSGSFVYLGDNNGTFEVQTAGSSYSTKLAVTSGGNVGIGTSSPSAALDVLSGSASVGALKVKNASGASASTPILEAINGGGNTRLIVLNDGSVGIGTTPSTVLHINDASDPILRLQRGGAAYSQFQSDSAGSLYISADAGDSGALSRMQFNVDGSERMRIDGAGNTMFRTTDTNPSTNNVEGHAIGATAEFSRSGSNPVDINRVVDGSLIIFRGQGTSEGNVSVSGTTVSYNGGHLSRWSQSTNGARIDGLVKGTVMTNLDQMAVWGDEENEQLNCMAISSVEGDPNVAGVFVNWDDDDETYTADMNIAMTGDMIIRIAQGTTVERGDLLMSAGDGTAKPQGDDIIRSKTIAKVTSIHVSCTYDDGSYCVPCVLMAC